MPDASVRNPDMDFVNTPSAPLAAIIACGHVLGGRATPCFPAADLPCYQALGPWGEPDAGLPWFRIGQDESACAFGERTLLPPARAAPLASILHRTDWLLLAVGSDHDSLSLALAIATYARGRGIHVVALLAGGAAHPFFQRDMLLRCVEYASECPAGLDPLLAAQALWSSVGCRGGGDVTFADLSSRLAGAGSMAWSPLPGQGDHRLEAMLMALRPLRARRCLWAVLIRQQRLSPSDYALAGGFLRQHYGEDVALVTPRPLAGSLPEGLFVFSA